MMDCVVVSTTVEQSDDADRLADAVVAAKLAACVQVMPIRSTYRWEGRIEHASELLLSMKTRRDASEALMAFVRERHPYKVPELTVMAIEGGSPGYLEWIRSETEYE